MQSLHTTFGQTQCRPLFSAAWLRLLTVESCVPGGLAQLVERVLCKHEVSGSSPLSSTPFICPTCQPTEGLRGHAIDFSRVRTRLRGSARGRAPAPHEPRPAVLGSCSAVDTAHRGSDGLAARRGRTVAAHRRLTRGAHDRPNHTDISNVGRKSAAHSAARISTQCPRTAAHGSHPTTRPPSPDRLTHSRTPPNRQ